MNQYEERAAEINKAKRKLNKKMRKLSNQLCKLDDKMIELHRENLDDVHADEIPERYLKGIRVEANGQWGSLTDSTRYHLRFQDGTSQLYGGQKGCNHQIALLSSGYACTRCPGWYCA